MSTACFFTILSLTYLNALIDSITGRGFPVIEYRKEQIQSTTTRHEH